MNLWQIVGCYILYAFTQASIFMKFGGRDTDLKPVADFMLHLLFALLISVFIILFVPFKLLELYANQLVK